MADLPTRTSGDFTPAFNQADDQPETQTTSTETTAVPFRVSQLPTYIILTVCGIIGMLPFAWMLSSSLMTLGETINKQWLPSTPQFANYAEAWQEAEFARYFLNSVIITAVTLTGLLVSSTLAAYAFARIKFPGRNLIFTVLLVSLMIPETVTFIPNFLLVRGDIIPWGSWFNRLPALTVPFMGSAFSIFLLRQFFARLPQELWDAAQIDGAGHLIFLLRVVIPMSRPVLLTVTLFAFISSWNAFLWPLLVTTDNTWRPLMVGLYNFRNEAGTQTHLLMAASVISIVPVLILYFFTQKQFTEGLATSGLKG